LFRQVVGAAPGNVEALAGVGLATLQLGEVPEALDWFRGALEHHPGAPELLHGYGQSLLKAGRPLEALRPLEAAARSRKGDPKLLLDLRQAQEAAKPSGLDQAAKLLAHGRIEEAVAELEQQVRAAPSDPQVLEAFGRALLQDGRLLEAERSLTRALSLRDDPRTRLLLADVLTADDRRQDAEQAIREAIALAPNLGQAWLRLAHARTFKRVEDDDLKTMEAIACEATIGEADAEALQFALAKAYDDLRMPREAFDHMQRANGLHAKRQPFDLGAMLALMDRIEAVCDRDLLHRELPEGSSSAVPVFIVGVPRCGSTLVEQVIAAHPKAYGVGELRTLARLTADLPSRMGTRTPFPECLRELRRGDVAWMADAYLKRLTRDAPADVSRVCDKMLSHVLLVGLISMVFPRATVIHCKRNLMDTGLSMYLQSFSGPGVGYAYDLEHIGQYHERCTRLMDHWKHASPMRIVDVEYEALVRDPEAGVRELLSAVNLDWDPRCMQPHLSKRQVRTVSDWQVRRPIHTGSVQRWRAYEEQLAPLRKYSDLDG